LVTAERFADVGWKVYATARDVEKIAPLERSGCGVLPLDVTDEDSMISAVEEIERLEGAVGVLVNNAGLQPVRVCRGAERRPALRGRRLRRKGLRHRTRPHPHRLRTRRRRVYRQFPRRTLRRLR
jgi:NAD(P)-dependent dehydrogenase (short-subunit alcohol dehydrogenase family)